ncbi:MAG TPA: cell division topological specificity factor MinE [Firmicutes bacterium]|nr:cell division topological specificity factor MinE [Bacillota bacterium]
MFDFVSWILGKKDKPRSKDLAKERLKLVLTHDRVDISPQMFEKLRRDLAIACAKYVEIDEAGMNVRFDSQDRTLALVASVPVIGTKRTSYSSKGRGKMG